VSKIVLQNIKVLATGPKGYDVSNPKALAASLRASADHRADDPWHRAHERAQQRSNRCGQLPSQM